MMETKRLAIDEIKVLLQEEFPDVRVLDVVESPEDSQETWILVSIPPDDDRLIQLTERMAERETELLIHRGINISVVPWRIEEDTSVA